MESASLLCSKADFGVKGSAFRSKFEDLMPRVRIGFGVLVQSFKLTLGRCHDVSPATGS